MKLPDKRLNKTYRCVECRTVGGNIVLIEDSFDEDDHPVCAECLRKALRLLRAPRKKAPKKKSSGKKGPARKLDTPEDIEEVCVSYYLSPQSVSQIARIKNVSQGVIDRILKENGVKFNEDNREILDKWRSER